MIYIAISHDEYLAHHGVKGMKWGVRRYQNPDGSLTQLDKVRELDLASLQASNYKARDMLLKENARAAAVSALKTQAKRYGTGVGVAAATTAGLGVVSSKSNDKIVREYRSEHPNSKLSYREILQNERGY